MTSYPGVIGVVAIASEDEGKNEPFPNGDPVEVGPDRPGDAIGGKL